MQQTVCGANSIRYTIAKGQTLYAIAQEYNTTVQAILDANPGLDVQLYYAGRRDLHPAACNHAHPADRLRRRHGVHRPPRRQLLPSSRSGSISRWPICLRRTRAWTRRGCSWVR